MAKKTTKRASTKPRVSKYERAAISCVHTYLHQNSAAINSRIKVLEVEHEEAEIAINAMTTALANLRDKRARLDAEIKGLSAVLAKRTV